MRHRTRRRAAIWVGLAALLCQILLSLGHNPAAELLGFDCPGLVAAATEHRDNANNSAASSSQAPPLQRSDHEHKHSCPVCDDLQFATPLITVDPPALLAMNFAWVVFVADGTAAAPPAAVGFSRPLPRAPPLPA